MFGDWCVRLEDDSVYNNRPLQNLFIAKSPLTVLLPINRVVVDVVLVFEHMNRICRCSVL